MNTSSVKIFRFNPSTDKEPYFQDYLIQYDSNWTILDVLLWIREKKDPSLSFEYCCRNGKCGLCSVMVNKKPVLACKEIAQREMKIEPLDGLMVIKDLIVDREAYNKKLSKLRLFLERDQENDEKRNSPEKIDMNKFEWFKIASRCIECLSCLSVCPVYGNNEHNFIGPAALVLEARHLFDPRDELNRELIIKSQGIKNCLECGRCSEVCPQDLDPMKIIKRMKNICN